MTLQHRYVHGNGIDNPLLWYDGSTVSEATRRHLYANWQGSIAGITDGKGELIHVNAYDAYGIPNQTNIGRFQYTGQIYLPELGIYHYKARAYSATLGRFLQTDPIGYEDQYNLYAYVGNEPVGRIDPDGEAAQAAAAITCTPGPQAIVCAGLGAATVCTLVEQCRKTVANGTKTVLDKAEVIIDSIGDFFKDDESEKPSDDGNSLEARRRPPTETCDDCGAPHGGSTETGRCPDCEGKHQRGDSVKKPNIHSGQTEEEFDDEQRKRRRDE